MNGDFKNTYYEAPLPDIPENKSKKNVMDTNVLPFSLWPLVHILHEWCLVVNTVVVIAFWLIEGPFMIYY